MVQVRPLEICDPDHQLRIVDERIGVALCFASASRPSALHLIDLLLCFGQPGVPECVAEDINYDGVVNVLDLIQLLLAFGQTCP